MHELVTIPIATIQVTLEYASPRIEFVTARSHAVEELFKAFQRWGIRIDDLEVILEGKLSEQGVRFRLPIKRTSFFFGAGSCKLLRDDADWETAPETIEILQAGWDALASSGAVKIGSYHVDLAMHLQLKDRPFLELLAPFAPAPLTQSTQQPITAVASVLRWKDRRLTIDGSGQLANAIFLRLERDFPGNLAFKEVATELFKDEQEILNILGVMEQK